MGFCTKHFNLTGHTQISKKFICSMSAFTLLKYHHNQTLNTYCSNCGTYHGNLCSTSTQIGCQMPGDPKKKLAVSGSGKCLRWCWETKFSHKFFDMRAIVLVMLAQRFSYKWYDDTFTSYLEQSGVQCVMKIYTRSWYISTALRLSCR